jgi:hypothetical protein
MDLFIRLENHRTICEWDEVLASIIKMMHGTKSWFSPS